MLKIQFRDGRSEPVVLASPGKTIGKGKINDIVIDVDGVSGFHTDLSVDGDQVIISDVDTKTGTHLNGERLEGPAMLSAGDIVTIQGVELEVLESDSDANDGTLILSGTAIESVKAANWSLILDSGPEQGQMIPVRQVTTIGRGLECDISILEPGVSRKHAELDPGDDKLLIRDLDSANGTFVNGKKVSEIQLEDSDVLQFNEVKFVVRAPGCLSCPGQVSGAGLQVIVRCQ
jgi:pSer/pThr/pTyr-binding forkhead associated (FHA) protein